ncbi:MULTISPECIES: hypothetical protein [unclassified Arthrobacter]|uniref:hypothetical protein n=1 Tax=unclassified Arthrobacter TaxID=235627 RepID=UPI001D135A75|nr:MULTISPECIES: hypothetical protein [unclassified Arthrobacter]MCC3274761.1 hypothetical protein [Arthrobacter sp. zg-Y20]MCC3279270.1 hypothetical protein [Arthrobacter sp. zg-Y40]MCC9177646.1 hypothetical protein [Arthrobacter sp. zg-Y750]MDK1314917.1 hypothetical protein [Arthrobacter sp. zg.Y20]MDK1327778.1 hypothetical protein [Arthrobacter sp. zg-Y1143]
MSIDPRIALQSLVTAFEEHLAAAASRRGEKDPVVESAYLAIADAFEVYEEVLYDAYGEVTPLEIYEDDEDDYEALEDDTDPITPDGIPGDDGNENGNPLGRPASR